MNFLLELFGRDGERTLNTEIADQIASAYSHQKCPV